MTFDRSSAQVDQSAGGLKWQLGQLLAGATSTIEVDLRCGQRGPVEFCADVTSAGGPSASQCASVDVANPATIQVDVVGPATAQVGGEVTFDVTITNRGTTPLSDASITIDFDEGLVHESSNPDAQRISSDLGGLGAGEVRDDLKVTLRVTKAGNLCLTTNVQAEGASAGEVRKCVTAAAATTTSPDRGPGPNVSPGIQVRSAGPRVRKVGETALFETTIRNTGDVTLVDVRIEASFEGTLEQKRATGGFEREGDVLVWRIDRLERGQTILRQAEVHCRGIDENACMTVTVTANPNILVGDEAWCENRGGRSARWWL